MEMDLDQAVILEEDEKIMASGARSGPVLKCIAVGSEYEGEGLIGKIVTDLLIKAHYEGINHLFLFTNPANVAIFSELGFHEVTRVEDSVVLMENKNHGMEDYLKKLTEKKVMGKSIASIVMNCNPFTLGHLYLVEKACKENDHVHLFVLDENRSIFPTDIRIKLVEKGTKHLKNLTVHHSGNYIISAATFPSYFLKESKKIVHAHGIMDLKLFTEYIAPVLAINRRYVGREPLCDVTNHYNDLMNEILPSKGIELVIVDRKLSDQNIISASFVRDLLKNKDYKNIKKMVPHSTLDFLKSREAESIISKI